MNDTLKKLIIAAIAIFLLFPFALQLLPEAVTFARAKAAFEGAGLTVSNYRETDRASNEAIAEASMTVNNARVQIWQYGHEGKIVMYEGYQKADPGQSIVQSWGLAEAMGAAVPVVIPHSFKRKGMFLIVATSEDVALNEQIIALFAKL